MNREHYGILHKRLAFLFAVSDFFLSSPRADPPLPFPAITGIELERCQEDTPESEHLPPRPLPPVAVVNEGDCTLSLYSGQLPAAMAARATGTLLATVLLDRFGRGTGDAEGSGTAAYFRVRNTEA